MESSGYLSVYLCSVGDKSNEIAGKVTQKFSILDRNGKPLHGVKVQRCEIVHHGRKKAVDCDSEGGAIELNPCDSSMDQHWLPSDTLTILLEIDFLKVKSKKSDSDSELEEDDEEEDEDDDDDEEEESPPDNPLSTELAAVRGMLTDCTLVCGNTRAPCHRIILSARSPVFEAVVLRIRDLKIKSLLNEINYSR